MVSFVRYNLLASAVAVALIGSTMSPAIHAQNLDASSSTAAAQSGVSRYIITFSEPGALYYTGGVSSLKGTAPDAAANGDRKFHASSPEAVAYRSFLRETQTNRIADLNSMVGHALKVTHRYEITMNGIAAELTAAEADLVSRAPGVKSVNQEQIYHTDTFRGPTFIGAPTIWNAPTPGGNINRGKGVTVGVLDSGVNSAHPSFADEASCNYTGMEKKLLSATDCSVVTAGVCAGPNPEAVDSGHGVHTASTAAGAVVTNSATPSPDLPAPYTQLSGVAPCASIRTYKVCPGTTCPGADIIGGVDSAIADGVDVINFSISGGTSPWSDNDRNFLDALNADILVAASAGNTSASVTNPVGQVNHRGPWVMTVAASTQDVNIGAGLSATGPGTPPANTQNILTQTGSNTPAAVPFASSEIRYNAANPIGCTATGGFPAGFFAGSVALVPRGSCAFTEKAANAAAAGATALFVSNNTFGTINMNTDGATIPTYSMTQASGNALIAFITANGATPTTSKLDAKIAGTVQGDVIADFSFRGPTPGNLADLTKPDITGPGVNILAAGRVADGNFFTISGTSMSSPHLAGSAALIRAVQPSWTPAEVKSAIMMTAKSDGSKENGTDPWNIDDVGNGRVDLNFASTAGLVMNETFANFLAANPVGGTINVKELNLPSVRNMTCTPDCTFTRTVRSTLAASANWSTSFTTTGGMTATVTPATFTIAAGATQVLTIKVTPTGAPIVAPAVGFGNILLTAAGGASPVEHIAVAVRGTGDGIFANGFDSVAPPVNPNLVTFNTNAPVFDSLNGTCIKWLTGVVRDNLGSCTGDDFNPYTVSGTPRALSFFWSYTGATANRGGTASGSAYIAAAPGTVIGPT
ncbi:MAG: S8 family serine peptidase, partial [Dokdonella sp.]